MSGTTKSDRCPPKSARFRESGPVVLVVIFLALMLGIYAGFAGRVWGRYLAFAAFAVLLAVATLGEWAGWRKVERRRGRSRRLNFRRPRRSSPAKPPAVVAQTHRDRIRTRSPDVHEQAGSLLLGIIVVVVVLGGTAWVLTFLAGR